jgi:hypothetical protein
MVSIDKPSLQSQHMTDTCKSRPGKSSKRVQNEIDAIIGKSLKQREYQRMYSASDAIIRPVSRLFLTRVSLCDSNPCYDCISLLPFRASFRTVAGKHPEAGRQTPKCR